MFGDGYGDGGYPAELIGGPIMFPWQSVVGNSRVFVQGCGNAAVFAGCGLVDGCAEVVGSGGLGAFMNSKGTKLTEKYGASVAMGYAFPFPGHNSLGIYTGPSYNLSAGWGGAAASVSWNGSGVALSLGAATPGLGFSRTIGKQPKWGAGMCRNKPR